MRPPTILITGERGQLWERVTQLLSDSDLIVVPLEDCCQTRPMLNRHRPSIALCSAHHRSSTSKSLKMLKKIRSIDKNLPVILITTRSSESLAIAALRAGATDYIKTPFQESELLSRCRKLMRNRLQLGTHNAKVNDRFFATDRSMVGDSETMNAIKSYIERVARTDSTVLITGETGTGKELAAESIHAQSGRSTKPLIRINCSAMPEGLVESELFGHARGAFTGAVIARTGKFEMAGGGSLFLDEIGEMHPCAQSKILRCIESKRVYPLGGKGAIPLDVRIIAATNQDPEVLISEGKFREDLFYRLNVARLHLPPLRERRKDIPDLIAHGIQKLNQKFNRDVQGLKPDVAKLLLRYGWPGNVRELMNVLEGAFINMPCKRIARADLPLYFKKKLAESQHLPTDERKCILAALLETNWNKSTAATRLNWSRMTLYRKIKKYNIVENRSRER